MKRCFSSLIFLFLLSIAGEVFAQEYENASLTENEKKYLLEIGHTSEEIENLPVEVAK